MSKYYYGLTKMDVYLVFKVCKDAGYLFGRLMPSAVSIVQVQCFDEFIRVHEAVELISNSRSLS